LTESETAAQNYIYTQHIPLERTVKSGAVFKSNTSQAVRLPKEVALPESVKRVDIIPLGRGRLIVPAGEGWDSWFDEPGVSEDFMITRDQPKDQTRGPL